MKFSQLINNENANKSWHFHISAEEISYSAELSMKNII